VIAEQLTGRDRRTSERMSDDSTLLVSGYTKEGAAFAVVACINDISVGGISFFLDTPVCKNATLQLALCSRRIEGLIFAVRATALRILEDGSHPARYLIGARFQGQFVQIGSNPQIEDTARQVLRDVWENVCSTPGNLAGLESCLLFRLSSIGPRARGYRERGSLKGTVFRRLAFIPHATANGRASIADAVRLAPMWFCEPREI
jgi:hypothetical protein